MRSTDLHLNRTMAHRIRAARIGMGLHQNAFAERIGCRAQDVQAYETERQLVPAVVLLRLVKETGFSQEWFTRANPDAAVAPRPAALEMAVA